MKRVSLQRFAVLFFFFTSCVFAGPDYDLVLYGGRVIDPHSGLDARANIGIRDGRIAVISGEKLAGRQILDVEGLIVAPGFIDLHAHGQNQLANEYQVHDGVTTALELEMGVYPVRDWYVSRQGRAMVNFGATVSHAMARAAALARQSNGAGSISLLDALSPAYSEKELDGVSSRHLLENLRRGLRQGALGVGTGLAYLPGARRGEVFQVYQLAAEHGAGLFVHPRVTSMREPDSVSALQELIANTAASGAPTHVCHIGSAGGRQTPLMLEIIRAAQQRGVDISTEVYPYTAAHSFIGAAIFSGAWRENIGMDYSDLQWSTTGERLTEASFRYYRENEPKGYVIAHFIPEEIVETAIEFPGVMIASDGGRWENNAGHPRGAGTFSRVLGRYVRERRLLALNEALAKMTIYPAERLEDFVPAMRKKGRISVGVDADLTVFDADKVIDRATYDKPMQFSAGIEYVIVNGRLVVNQGLTVANEFPGTAVTGALLDQY